MNAHAVHLRGCATGRSARSRISAAPSPTGSRRTPPLGRLDGDADLEDGADAEPSLAAPENHHASQVGWCRGSDANREAEAQENVEPQVDADVVIPFPTLRWGGNGNVVAAVGVALMEMVAGR